jgi:putative peptide zinc metalloprotease protein
MPFPNLSDDVELFRRKRVRVRLRQDVAIGLQRYEGRSYYVVKDPVSLRYYRFDQFDYFMLQMFDGRHTLEEVQEAFEARFAPQRMTLEQLEWFAETLLKAGLISHYAPTTARVYFENYRKRRRSQIMQRLTNVLYIELPLFDPDGLLRVLQRWFGWLYRRWCVVLMTALMASALLLVTLHWDVFVSKLPAAHEFFSFQNLLLLWLISGAVKTLHELSHGVCCKTLGGEVHDMGALLMCLSPCFYINVSDAWTFTSKWKRMAVGAAGMYVEMILASVATWTWWNTLDETGLHHMCLCVMTVCGINTLLLNGNPLLRFDGYYILADWMELPNLREQCNALVKRAVAQHALGIEMPPEKPMALKRQIGFFLYAVASYLYSWFVTFAAIWFLSQFLKPYKLGTISMLLACFAAASMIGWPLYYLGQGIYERGGRLPDMKPRRVSLTIAILLAIIAGIVLVPLPISRIRQMALVQIEPDAKEMIYVLLPGTLEAVHVRDGQWVAKDAVLGELRNRDVETKLDQARTEVAIRLVQLRTLRDRLSDSNNADEQSRLAIQLAQTDGERQFYARQVEINEKQLQQLVIRAPRQGIVFALPRREEIGKLWDKKLPIAAVGDPGRLRALVPLQPDDYQILQHDLGVDPNLPVTLRVQGWAGRTWRGRITMLPATEAKNVPLPLTTRAGGPLPTNPRSGANTDEYEPQSQHYLVGIEILDAEHDGIWPGTLAQVKIHCQWRSMGWWMWRKFCLLFGVGLGG